MNKKLIFKWVVYIIAMLCCAYLTITQGLIVYLQYLGMQIVILHPLLPLTEEYTGELNFMPMVYQLMYFVLTWVYFGVVGWRGLRSLKTQGGK